jgi:exodeoxyribonuclease VII large subunit
MPLPVVVGVGHDRDVSVLDMVASLSLKTPTAVAQNMVQQFVQAYQKVLSLQERITKGVENVLHKQQQRLQTIEALLPVCAMRLLEKKESKLHLLERSVELLSPLTILKKGYTMTLKNGVVASFADIKPGDEITTVFHNGSIHSKIHQVAQ